MLRITVVTLFPDMLQMLTDYGVTSRAVNNSLLEVTAINPRDFSEDNHRTVDDRPYGGGPGMVMMVGPLKAAINSAKEMLPKAKVVYLSPQGKTLDQKAVQKLVLDEQLILLAGRYEGIDERLISSEVDEEWSIGDYVVSGGELPAMVLIDAMSRTIPGVLGHEDSAEQDSFSNGLLDCPHYTRPEYFEGENVPQILLSGDHELIRRWRLKQSLGRTSERRPDLLNKLELNDEQQQLLDQYKAEQ